MAHSVPASGVSGLPVPPYGFSIITRNSPAILAKVANLTHGLCMSLVGRFPIPPQCFGIVTRCAPPVLGEPANLIQRSGVILDGMRRVVVPSVDCLSNPLHRFDRIPGYTPPFQVGVTDIGHCRTDARVSRLPEPSQRFGVIFVHAPAIVVRSEEHTSELQSRQYL